MIFAQTVGPFNTKLSRRIIPYFLNKADLITIREPNSLQYLEQFTFSREPIATADIAYLLQPKIKREYFQSEQKKVVICVRDFQAQDKRQVFFDTVVTLSGKLIERGHKVVIVSHLLVDDTMGLEIAKAVPCAEFIPFGQNPCQLKALYGSCEFLVSARMHPTIFAAEQCIPFISVAYNDKFLGMIAQLEYSAEFLFDSNDISVDKLLRAISSLQQDQEVIKKHLRDRLPEIRLLARENIRLLSNLLYE